MKKAYLIHGWAGNSESEAWFPWLQKELENKKIKLIRFNMPNPETPKIKEWVDFLIKNIKQLDENTYFIGHSIGCQTILRFLEKLHEGKKIAGAVFVAGWFDLKDEAYEEEEEKDIAKPWIKTPVDFEKVKKHCNNFLAIFSNDDPCVDVSQSKIFQEKLGAKIIIKDGEEHFNDTKKIEEIINFILKE